MLGFGVILLFTHPHLFYCFMFFSFSVPKNTNKLGCFIKTGSELASFFFVLCEGFWRIRSTEGHETQWSSVKVLNSVHGLLFFFYLCSPEMNGLNSFCNKSLIHLALIWP